MDTWNTLSDLSLHHGKPGNGFGFLEVEYNSGASEFSFGSNHLRVSNAKHQNSILEHFPDSMAQASQHGAERIDNVASNLSNIAASLSCWTVTDEAW